ncbi:hypothetical protein GCM10009765_40360 [Fodinicola feengrottensis]|uniref:Uncharacterized protein n=1 Tax=Fodinicola feengrottensis TaxID=435914 RepID=A0ABP4TEK1_9ACTN
MDVRDSHPGHGTGDDRFQLLAGCAVEGLYGENLLVAGDRVNLGRLGAFQEIADMIAMDAEPEDMDANPARRSRRGN